MQTVTRSLHGHRSRMLLAQGKHYSAALLQIGFICLLAWGAHGIATLIHSPIPGSVIGMFVVLLALALKIIPEKALQLGAAWFIGDLLLFFIPPMISVLKYENLLESYGLNILLTLVVGSASVIIGTGFVVDRVFRFERRLHLKRQLAKQKMKADGTL